MTVTESAGTLDARGRRFAVVASRFNHLVVSKLLEGALECFRSHGIDDDDLFVAWVPGAFEIPIVARRLASGGGFHAIVSLGAVIRGETNHFELVTREAARGIQQVMLEADVPVLFGVVTAESLEQALERAGGKHGNKGWEAALGAMRMASLLEELPKRD